MPHSSKPQHVCALATGGLLIMISACSSEAPGPQELHTEKQEIVINERNVKQARGALMRADLNYQVFDLVSARREYRLSAMLQASPSIRVWKNTTSEGRCGEGPLELSSGVMTSDSRLMGSAHSLFGADVSPTPPSTLPLAMVDEVTYRVSYGGLIPDVQYSPEGSSGTSSPQWSQSGHSIPDEDSNPNNAEWEDDYDPSWYHILQQDRNGYSEIEEENPLLANRLFSLGLEHWSEFSNKEVRNRLRTSWPFGIDHSSPSNDEYDQFESQGMAEVYSSGLHWKGFDIAFLKALEHDHLNIATQSGNPTYLASGPFTLDRPAMFFNQVDLEEGMRNEPLDPSDAGRSEYLVEHGEPLHLLHSRSWPREFFFTGVPIPNITNLISYPGYRHLDYIEQPFWMTNPHEHRDLVGRFISCKDGASTASVFRSFANSVFFHTVDAGPGSSGGLMLVGKDNGDGQRSSWLTVGIGVHTGSGATRTTPGEGEGWEPITTPDAEEQPIVIEGSPFSNSQLGVLWGTWLNPQALSRARRDHPGEGTEDDPSPDSGNASAPGAISYPVTSDNYDTQIEGRGWSAFNEARDPNVPRTPWTRDPTNFEQHLEWSETSMDGIDPPGGEGPGGVPGSTNHGEYAELEYHCDNDNILTTPYEAPYAGKKGYLIGVTGARSHREAFNGLVSYGSVCSPWSDKSWSDNWGFLGVTTTPWHEAHKARNTWPDKLVNLLRSAFYTLDLNTTGEFLVKPMALKTCPPNYAVSQVQFEINIEGDTPFATSIEALQCTPITEDVLGGPHDQLMVTTNAGSKHSGYTMGGAPFTLRQEIGLVDPNDKTYERDYVWVGCAPNQVMVSLAMQYATQGDAEGMIIGVNPGCRNKP